MFFITLMINFVIVNPPLVPARGQKLNNNTGIQDSKKRKAIEDLIDQEGARANKRRITCK